LADNVAITAGSGTTLASDDIGGVQYPRAKVTWGPDGTANDADVASGKPLPIQHRVSDGTAWTYGSGAIAAGTPRVALATDSPGIITTGTAGTASATVLTVQGVASMTPVTSGGVSALRIITMSTDTGAYASGDLIADTQQYDAFFRVANGTGVINTITVTEKDAQGAAIYIIIHRTSTSMGTENSAPNISDANLVAGIQHIIAVATTDYVTVSGTKIATLKNLGLPVMAVSGTDDLYISILNSTGTPTYASGEIQLALGVLLD
jgi:hypothetical protein